MNGGDDLDQQLADAQLALMQGAQHPDVVGAPMKVRFLVGLAKGPENALATLQKYQGDRGVAADAQWIQMPHQVTDASGGGGYVRGKVGVDPHASATEKGPEAYHTTMIYTDPDSKRRTLVNPPGLDIGDVVAHSRDLARMIAFTGASVAGGELLPGGQFTGTALGVGASQGTDEFIDRVLGPKLGIVDDRPESQKWIDRGEDVAMEGGQMLALNAAGRFGHAIGEAATPGSGGLGPMGARLRIPGAAGSGRPEVARAALDLGIDTADVPSAVLSKSRTVEGLDESALKNPHTNELTQGRYDRFMQKIRDSWEQEVPGGESPALGIKPGQVRKDIAGKGLQQDLSTWKDTAAVNKGRMETMTDRVMEAEPVDVSSALEHYKYAVEKGAGGRFPPEFKTAMALAEKNNGMIPWDDARIARTAVGRELQDAKPADEQWLSPAYRRMTGGARDITDPHAPAATEGLEGAVNRVGGNAAKNWQTMMEYEKQTAQEWEEVRALAQQPDVQSAFNMAANSAAQGPMMLKALKEKLAPGTWERLVGTMARDKGMVTRNQAENAGGLQMDAVYSPTAFAKWYRDVKKSGSLDVIAEPGSPLRKALDEHATIGAAMEQSQVMRNFSRTATGIRYNEMLEGGAGPGGAAGAVPGAMPDAAAAARGVTGWAMNKSLDAYRALSARAQAKLLADPDFGQWMLHSRALKPRDPSGWNAYLSKLTGIATSKPDIREELGQLIQNLGANEETHPSPEEKAPDVQAPTRVEFDKAQGQGKPVGKAVGLPKGKP